MNRRWVILGCILATAGLAALGCDNNGGTDAGADSDSGGGTDAGPPPPAATVGTGTDRTMLSAADYTCAGLAPTPGDMGAEVTFTGNVTNFQTSEAVDGLEVQIFPDNMPSLDGSCTGTCVSTTSAGGTISVMDNEGSWFAYRIVPGMGTTPMGTEPYVQVTQFNNTAPAMGGDFTVNAVSAMTRGTILTLLGVTAEDGTATITGAAADCTGTDIANATVRVFQSDGTEIPLGFERTGPRQFYYASGLPAQSEMVTNVDGLFGATNIPVPADNTLRVEVWGTLTEGGTPQMLGCEETQVVADGISIVGVGPARMARSSACSPLP